MQDQTNFEEALVACLEAARNGGEKECHRLLASYPEYAAELMELLENHRRVEGLAAPFRQAAVGETIAHAATTTVATDVLATLGDYDLLGELGRGGMGVVYKAKQRGLNREVALKSLQGGGPDEERRFRQEAEAAASLDHPNIVPVYEVGGPPAFFTMKLIEGRSLAEALRTETQGNNSLRSPRLCAQLLATVARAVHHAHQRGILHRDLKPSNILLDAGGTPYVTDFGLARRVEGGGAMTLSGAIVGTPSYMAPEQAAGERRLTTAVDVYSLGAILYELLAGRPPFVGETALDTLVQLRTAEPARPSSLTRGVDRDLETICLKCLEKDPSRRYGSAEALADELDRWLSGRPVRARPVSRFERVWRSCKRKPMVAALTAAVTLLLVGAATGGTLLAFLAERRATESKKNEERADEERAKAKVNEQRADAEREKAERHLERAEWLAYTGLISRAQREREDGIVDPENWTTR